MNSPIAGAILTTPHYVSILQTATTQQARKLEYGGESEEGEIKIACFFLVCASEYLRTNFAGPRRLLESTRGQAEWGQ